VNSAILRELGAEVRTFKTIRGAMRWLADEDARRVRLEMPLTWGSAPASRVERDKRNATWAALCNCLSPADPYVDGFTLHHIGLFQDWCCAWTSQRELAKDHGMTLYGLRKAMRFVEGVLRARMEARGLLEMEQQAAA
jgi:hypothetical protein